MYCNFLGLRCLPFEDRIDTRFLYLSSDCNRLLASLEHDVHHERGVTPVFGVAGSGKTLLTRALVARLHASDHVAVVTCPRSGAVDLLQEVGKGFGVSISPSEGRTQYIRRLRGQLIRNGQADHRSILIVDQVEELTEENLGAVSSLVELRDSTGPLLSVVLFAQPHARETMNEPRFAALAQQFTPIRTIAPLNLSETQAYIGHRLAIAGSADFGIFDDGAVTLIHAAAEGNPRLINQLCHATLLAAYRAEARGVNESMASSVTTKLMQEKNYTPDSMSADRTNIGSFAAGPFGAQSSPARQPADRSEPSPFSLADITESIPSISTPDYQVSDESHAFTERQAPAQTAELSVMIGHGEGLMQRLELLLTRVDTATNDGSLALDAEGRLIELLEKAEHACDRADRTESRLSRFAEELGNQAEVVQRRIGELMGTLQAGQVLQDEIRKTIDQHAEESSATFEKIQSQHQSLESSMSEARKLETDLSSRTWDECQSKISEGFETKQRLHDEMMQQARRELQLRAGALDEKSRHAQEQADLIEKRFVAMTKEADHQIRRWRATIAQEEANVNSQLATLKNTKDEVAQQSEAEERARLASINAIESRLRAAMNQAAQSITESEKATERHDEFALRLVADLQEKCERTQADALADHYKTIQEDHDTQTRMHDEIVAIESRLRAVMSQAAQSITSSEKATERHDEIARQLVADLQEKCERTQANALADYYKTIQEDHDTQTRMHDDEIVAIESRLRAVTSQTAQSITDSEKATERHDEFARQLVADLQEKCERTQADALADHYKTIQENHETQARRLDEVVASTEKRLTELDRRATAIAERIVESSKQNAAQLESEEKRLRDTLDEAFVDCKQTQSAMVTRLQQVAEEARGLQEKALSELARTTKEFDDLIDHAKITNTDLIATQHRGENLLRETHAATGKIESMNHNVSQTLVDIGSASERVGQAREQLQAAEQVAARLIAAIDSGERIESKLDEVTGNAADLRDAFVRTSAEAETKLGQLGSHSAAAAHVLSKLSEANIDAHDVLERTTKTMMAARETGENTKSEMERLLKDVSSLKNTVETAAAEMTDGTEHAVALTKRLGKVIRTANELSGELTGELTGRTDEAKQSAETLDRQCTQANTLIDRLGNSAQLLDGAGQVQTDLVESIDQARVIDVELRSTADDAVVKTAQLETNRQSASELIEAHEGLSAQTRDLIVQLDLGIADARSTTEASQQLLEQYTRHGKTLHGVLERLGRRANKLEESLDQLTEKPSTIVAEAQAQAAQLEQVCSAVGRVFAKLSKASLEAHEQTKECHRASKTAFERLEQLRSETDGTSRSLQTWLEHTLRVGGELAQSLGSTRTNLRAPTPGEQAVRIANRSAEDPDFTEIDTAKTDRPYGETGGDILKTAEAPRSIENPTALAMARKPGRAKEIAGMIADAKAADTAKT